MGIHGGHQYSPSSFHKYPPPNKGLWGNPRTSSPNIIALWRLLHSENGFLGMGYFLSWT